MEKNKPKEKKCPRCDSVIFNDHFLCAGCEMIAHYYETKKEVPSERR